MIPAEAVEAAADIIVQGDRGACECRRSMFDKHDVNPPCSTRRNALRVARAALEAAAPYIRADALLDAADDVAIRGDIISKNNGGMDAWEYLRARAETEKGKL